MLRLVQGLWARRVLVACRLGTRGALLAAMLPSALHAQTSSAPSDWQFRLGYAPAAYHRNHNEEHVPYNHLVASELLFQRGTVWNAQRALVGLALFNNSFGQFSQYAYVGQEWDLAQVGPGTVFVNLTMGLLHGYRGEHRDKIPFNQSGTAPVIIPTAGWRYQQASVSLIMLGTNGLMLGASWTFDRL